MTDKPDTTTSSSVPEDNRGLQPTLSLTGVFGALLGLGAVIIASKAGSKRGHNHTPSGP